jgi:transcriptional regulator with XRE-family HTH domain
LWGEEVKITSAIDIGRMIKQKRKDDGLTLEDAAAVCGVSYAFLSALENGKETVRLNKILQVIKCLGIELEASIRTWASPGDES